VVNVSKTVNASCVNRNVHKLVEAKGHSCFQSCAQPTNTTTDCWIECFFQTLLGRDPLHPEKILTKPLEKREVLSTWLAGFESDDESKGGCPQI
jgi:hypothetical protein